MTLIGSREDWQELLRRNDEGWPLKEEHVACIERALASAPSDARNIDVDAGMTALRQAAERTNQEEKEQLRFREIAASIADSDESWWIHRARRSGLKSIVPIDPWPRVPAYFHRPPGYLHTYGPENPQEGISDA